MNPPISGVVLACLSGEIAAEADARWRAHFSQRQFEWDMRVVLVDLCARKKINHRLVKLKIEWKRERGYGLARVKTIPRAYVVRLDAVSALGKLAP